MNSTVCSLFYCTHIHVVCVCEIYDIYTAAVLSLFEESSNCLLFFLYMDTAKWSLSSVILINLFLRRALRRQTDWDKLNARWQP